MNNSPKDIVNELIASVTIDREETRKRLFKKRVKLVDTGISSAIAGARNSYYSMSMNLSPRESQSFKAYITILEFVRGLLMSKNISTREEFVEELNAKRDILQIPEDAVSDFAKTMFDTGIIGFKEYEG